MRTWEDKLHGLPGPQREAMEFLEKTMPLSDLDCYPFELFFEFTMHSLMLRERLLWCGNLSDELFLNYVLNPRAGTEDISSHRPFFYNELMPRVQSLELADAIQEVNRWCHEHASYEMQDARTASPMTVYRAGSGRCGEESVFLVSALRSVGIAARQVYAPRWSHCDDNHAWVEAWCGSYWCFLGACEPEPLLDLGWFNAAVSRAMLVTTDISRYALTKTCAIRIVNPDYSPVVGALVNLQILNTAELVTVATYETDNSGIVTVKLGIGDIFVSASDGISLGFGLCKADDRSFTLRLGEIQSGSFDVYAPTAGALPPPLTPELKEQRNEVLRRGSELRAARRKSFYDTGLYTQFPDMADVFDESGANIQELARFLRGGDSMPRKRLLRTLAKKDYRDIKAEVLEEHLSYAAGFETGFPPDIFEKYLLCPRIGLEKITAWRRALGAEREDGRTPAELWTELEDMQIVKNRTLPGLLWTPAEAERCGRCDAGSRKILMIAKLRTRGIPARLNSVTGDMEYWQDGEFLPVVPQMGMAELVVTKAAGQEMPYGKSWTIAQKLRDIWRTLRLGAEPDGICWKNTGSCDELRLQLEAGQYRIISTLRMLNGNQLADITELTLEADTITSVALKLREYKLSDMLLDQEMPKFTAPDFTMQRLRGRLSVLIWLDVGTEPTEHLLIELNESMGDLCELPVKLIFFVKDTGALEYPALAALLGGWEGVSVICGDWEYNADMLARRLYRDADRPPLTIVCNSSRVRYASDGYQIGLAQQIIQVLRYLSRI